MDAASNELAPAASAPPKAILGYEILDLLGEGADSTIYAACDPADGQIYALKHVARKTEKCDRVFQRLENEYGVGRMVNHPLLRKSVALKSDNLKEVPKSNEAALLLELFDGVPLPQQMPRDMPEFVSVFRRTAEAMYALNQMGLVHCDMKPNNILIGADGSLKVIDFGLACPVGTKKPRVQGTADYIAPEQAKCRPVSIKTDIFNLGATIYWVLTGRNWPTLLTLQNYQGTSMDPTAPPHILNRAVPLALSNLVIEMVHMNRDRRPKDMQEVIDRIDAIKL